MIINNDNLSTFGGAALGFALLQQVNWMALPEYAKLATALAIMIAGYFAYRDKNSGTPKAA